jgi:hypothetical protein
MKYEAHLNKVSECVEKYQNTPADDGNTLVEINQQLTSSLFFLEKERAVYKERWDQTKYKLILAGENVSKAENKADVIVPEIYMLRRVMDAGYKVADAIRTQVSWIKSGLQNV